MDVQYPIGKGKFFDTFTIEATTAEKGSNPQMSGEVKDTDLNLENVILAPYGKIIYKVTGKVSEKALGELVGNVVLTKEGENKKEAWLNIKSELPSLNIYNRTGVASGYAPGETILYSIEILNDGKGYAYLFDVVDNFADIKGKLANDSLSETTDSKDINKGQLFDSATVEIIEIGENSSSQNFSDVKKSTLNLIDKVIIAPNEKIVYEVLAKTNKTAIGVIKNNVTLSKEGTGVNLNEEVITRPIELNTENIKIDKTTDIKEYEPGQEVEYIVTVSNMEKSKFVNNFNLNDDIKNIKTKKIDGTVGEAFSSWKFEIVSPTDYKNGTKPGIPENGIDSESHGDININIDIAPETEIIYKLTGVIEENSVGLIVDRESFGEDNVVENGNGITSFPEQINAYKNVDEVQYSPNGKRIFDLVIENKGKGHGIEIPVKDELSKIMTIAGKKAFSESRITASLESIDGGIPRGKTGIVGTLENQDLNVIANIGPRTKIVYKIEVTMDSEAIGIITNTSTIGKDGNSVLVQKKILPKDPKVRIEALRVSQDSYPNLNNDLKKDFTVDYTIKVSNDEDAGYASNVEVKALFRDTITEKLDGSTYNPFKSIVLSDIKTFGENTKVLNSQINNKNLESAVNITAGGYVEYKVTAVIERKPNYGNETKDIIPYGNIVVPVKVTPKKIDGATNDETINGTMLIKRKNPRLTIEKSTTNKFFRKGEWVDYRIVIKNIGEGYANDARVKDILKDKFSEWTIKSKIDTPYIGTNSDIESNLSKNKEIDLIVDIAPKGEIIYDIRAKVRNDYQEERIINTGTVTDSQSNNEYASSAELVKNENIGLYITKRSDLFEHIPGKPIIYTIEVNNVSGKDIEKSDGYTLVDRFSEISVGLVNDEGKSVIDIKDFPFEKVEQINSAGQIIQNIGLEKDFRIPLEVEKDETEKYYFRCYVSDRVLRDKIRNETVVETSDKSEVAIAVVETNGGGRRGSFTRTVDKKYYTPGDEITYTITAKGGSDGYLNNQTINEIIIGENGDKGLLVDLIDGTKGNPFYNKNSGRVEFEVIRKINGQINGRFNDPCSVQGEDVKDNENIGNFKIDVGPNDEIVYIITGKVRSDADGIINYRGLETEPYRHNLNIKKSLKERRYIPGKEITFLLEIENLSKGNAGIDNGEGILVTDDIANLKVLLSDGSEGYLFDRTKGWEITYTTKRLNSNQNIDPDGDLKNEIPSGSTTENLKAHAYLPMNTAIIYEIKGTVNEKAVGSAINISTVDGDKSSTEIKRAEPQTSIRKKVIGYFDTDKTSSLSGGYKPDGWIEYEIEVKNLGNGIEDNLPLGEDLEKIKVEGIDGNGNIASVDAFTEWEFSLKDYREDGATVPGYGIWDRNKNLILKNKILEEGRRKNPEIPNLSSEKIPLVLDIGPNSYVKLKVLAKVNKRAIGTIENIVTSEAKIRSAKSNSLAENINAKKIAYSIENGTINERKRKTSYVPGEEFYYKIEMENTGNGIGIINVLDEITKIRAEVAEDGINGNIPKEDPFESWEVTATKTNFKNPDVDVTWIGDFEDGKSQKNMDINEKIVIAPNAKVEFLLKMKLKDNVLGRIRNIVKVNGKTKRGVNIYSLPSKLEVKKSVTMINDVAPDKDFHYKPGDKIEYAIEIKNTGLGYGNNVEIIDEMSKIQSKIAGNTFNSAFKEWKVEVVSKGNSYIRETMVENAPLKTFGDIAPSRNGVPEVIILKATGILKEKVIGIIPENIVAVGGKKYKSEKLNPYAPEIIYYKTFVDDNFSEIRETRYRYTPLGNINYKIVIENIGEGYGDDIEVKDIFSSIKTSNGRDSFSKLEFRNIITDDEGNLVEGNDDGKTYLIGDLDGEEAISTLVDIAPKSKVEFYIGSKTQVEITGEITNQVKVSEGKIKQGRTDTVVSYSEDSDIIVRKELITPEYVPGGEIKYQIIIENFGKGNGKLNLDNIISEVKALGPDNQEIKAFQEDWVIESKVENGNTGSLLGNIPTSGDIKNTEIQIGAPLDENIPTRITITVVGKASDKAMGIITIPTKYDIGKGENQIAVNVNPVKGKMEITKTVDKARYISGEKLEYTLTIKNIGLGYAKSVKIEDNLNIINTDGVGTINTENIIKAFKNIEKVTYTKGDNSEFVGEPDKTDGILGTVNIAPNEKVEVKILGVVDEKAFGPIKNILYVDYEGKITTAENTIESEKPEIRIKTYISEDGINYSEDTVNYVPDKELYYRIVLENIGKGWDNDIILNHFIKDIKAISSDEQTEESVFDFSSLKRKLNLDETTEKISNIWFNDEDTLIRFIADLGPGKKIVFESSGTVNSNILGDIKYKTSYENSIGPIREMESNEVIATQKTGNILIIKKLMSSGGFNADEGKYIPGGEVAFKVSVKNTSDNFIKNIEIEDKLKEIETLLSDGTMGVAFKSWTVRRSEFKNIYSFVINETLENGKNLYFKGNLGPREEVDFFIRAIVGDTAVGEINNNASYRNNGGETKESNQVTLLENKTNIVIEKTVRTDTYEPGKELIFEVKIENQGDSIGDDIIFEADMDIETLLSDGTYGDAIDLNDITVEIISDDIVIPNVTIKNGVILTDTFDMPLGSEIKFVIKTKVKNNVTGDIKSIGACYVDNEKILSNEVIVKPSASFIEIEKIAEVDPKLGGYIPGEGITFRIDIKNTGLGIADNVKIVDKLDEVLVDALNGKAKAFDSWKYRISDITSPNHIPTEKLIKDKNLDVLVDVTPGSTISIFIDAIVNENAFGEIENQVFSDNNGQLDDDKAEFMPSRSNVIIRKTIDRNKYAPGEILEYTVELENEGPGISKNVEFVDDIKNIMTKTTEKESEGAFYINSIEITKELLNGAVENQKVIAEDGVVKGNLTLPRLGKVVYKIKAKLNENTIGRVENIAKFNYTDNDGTKKVGEAKVELVSKKAKLSIKKSVDKEDYLPEDTLTYVVQVENSGSGNANDVKIEDVISTIKTDGINEINKIKAFTTWTVEAKFLKDDGVSKIEEGSITIGNVETKKDIVLEKVDISPNNKLILTIRAKVSQNAIGKIENIAKYTYIDNEGNRKIEEAKVKSKPILNSGKLIFSKRALKDKIQKGEAVEYGILVKNLEKSHYRDVSVEDMYPSGFKYVKGSTEMILNGNDRVFGTADDTLFKLEPDVTSVIKFKEVGIPAGEALRIRYILESSVGTTFGKYENTAYAVSGGKEVSNRSKAYVEIVPDKIFDDATIIGKVFEDINQNGRQDDETEKGIPGIRVITIEGISAETDEFGRYHIPDRTVENKKGMNFLVKVDETTIPAGMKLVNRNPLVKRISPNSLSKFNFAITRDEEKVKDESRIYPERGGAIWVVKNLARLNPELKITVSEEAVVKNNKLENDINFSVETNYSSYIKKWKLEIFRDDDYNLSSPLKVLEGNELYNNMNIVWNGENDENYKLRAGSQILFRFFAYDTDGNEDKTRVGVLDLVKETNEVDMTEFGNDEEKIYGESNLMVQNIRVDSGMVRFFGSNLKDVNRVYIGEDDFDVDYEKFIAEEYYPVGNHKKLVTIEYEDGEKEVYNIGFNMPEKYLSHTGMADFYIGRNYVSKNDKLLSVSDEYENDIYDRGRLGYFGMAKLNDKLRITAQIDTRENDIKDLFKDIHKKDKTSIFDRFEDEEKYYPTYGDDSYITNEVDTQGKIYLEVEYDKSRYVWGNYNTGFTDTKFSRYNRSLYGAKANYMTRETTKFGDNKVNIIGFISEPDLLASHDEFLGTGGSLYFLKHGDISAGSEKVYVKVVNKTSGLTEDVVILSKGKDYEIDNYQGRIVLHRPLSDMNLLDSSTISGSGEIKNYLVVDYEYVPNETESFDKVALGGKIKVWATDHLGVGLTHVEEEKDRYDYAMTGGDLTYRLSENTYVTGEFSKSKGSQMDNNFLSEDGGLSFTNIDINPFEEREGEAKRVYGVLNLHDVNSEIFKGYGNEILGWYEEKDAGYSYADKDDKLYAEYFGIEGRFRNSNKSQLKLSYISNLERDINGKDVTDKKEISADIEYALTDRILYGLAGKYVKELKDNKIGEGTLVGAKVEYEVSDNLSLYIKAQTTIDKNSNYEKDDSVTVGGKYDVNDKLTVEAEGSLGDREDYLSTKLDYNVTEDYDVYLGYKLKENSDEDENNIIFGQRASLSEKLDVFQENQFLDEEEGRGSIGSYGFDYEMTEDHKLGFAFQNGKLDKKDENNVERNGISIYQKLDLDRTIVKNKFEFRKDNGDEKVYQYLTTNSFVHKISDEYKVMGKFNYSKSVNETKDIDVSEFIESNIGFAYRPIYNDKLNFLTRYTFFKDMENSDRDVDYQDEKSHIFEFESLYDYGERLGLGLKLAYKNKEELYRRRSGSNFRVKRDIYLVGLKSTYEIINDWDLFFEYHFLVDREKDDMEHGAILAITRHLNENFMIGAGYNFSSFSDNLKKDDYDARGWFINVLGKF